VSSLRIALLTALGVTVLVAACSSSDPTTTAVATTNQTDGCTISDAGATEMATTKLIIEYNATDGDLGVHGQFDDEGWSELCVFDPTGTPTMIITPAGSLGDLTVGSVFFESREPPLEEFGFTELAERFPAGDYRVLARSYDGEILAGTASFSHAVPAEPQITAPDLADEDAAEEALVSTTDLVVSWEPVTETVDGGAVDITGYEVIITNADHDDPNGFSQPMYDVHVSPDVTTLPVPPGFFEPDTVYEVEVLALEASGNQTIAVGFFNSAP
jgi:hypothetical protein